MVEFELSVDGMINCGVLQAFLSTCRDFHHRDLPIFIAEDNSDHCHLVCLPKFRSSFHNETGSGLYCNYLLTLFAGHYLISF